jgi:hypothetical protein
MVTPEPVPLFGIYKASQDTEGQGESRLRLKKLFFLGFTTAR